MTTETADWIYCRLVDRGTTRFPRLPFCLGQVEFSANATADRHAPTLESSMRAFAVSPTTDGPMKRLVRARVLLLGITEDTARRHGGWHLEETLAIYNAHLTHGFNPLRATGAGYIENIRTGALVALHPPYGDHEFRGMSFMMDEIAMHPFHAVNTLLAAPDAYGELGNSFRRCVHWRGIAADVEDESEQLLFYWMAAECLTKLSNGDYIVPKLLASLGFPTGNLARVVDEPTWRALLAIPGYRAWRKQLTKLVDELRGARNKIVHNGFRHIDLPDLLKPEQRALGLRVLPIIGQCLAGMALYELNRHRTGIRDMWRNYPAPVNESGLVRHVEWVLERLR